MSAQVFDQKQLEGTQFVAHIQAPGVPGQITYYPSKPTPEFEKKLKRDKVLGTVVAILGFAFVTLGFAMAFGPLGMYLVPILLAVVFSLIFTFLFVSMENVAMIKTARTLPIIGYITIILLWIFVMPLLLGRSLMDSMQDISQGGGSVPSVNQLIGSILGGLTPLIISNLIMVIGLMCMRGGATLLWDTHRMRTDFSPSIIVLGSPTPVVQQIAPTPQVQPPQARPPQLQPSQAPPPSAPVEQAQPPQPQPPRAQPSEAPQPQAPPAKTSHPAPPPEQPASQEAATAPEQQKEQEPPRKNRKKSNKELPPPPPPTSD